MDLAALRREYRSHGIDADDLDPDPYVQFRLWFGEYQELQPDDPNAVVVTTTDPATGRPSARNVLLKAVEGPEFVFFTNRLSRKGRELAANPQACLLFSWLLVGRQVVVEGDVAPIADDRSDAYFASRPRRAQIGAWASAQSEPLADRAELERAAAAVEERYAGGEVERPPHWGGYGVRPVRFEFWQGREDRLHDRIEYRPDGDGWCRVRLNP